MKNIFGQIALMLLISGILAGTVNSVHPRRIPWVQDWSSYVESKARDAGIEVVPLSVAFSLYEEGGHEFVDARPEEEYFRGHISGAASLPFEELDDRLLSLEPLLESTNSVIVYCSSRECDDALLLARELRDMGQSNLLYYVDGFELWKEEGCPVESN